MSRHYLFRMIVASMHMFRSRGHRPHGVDDQGEALGSNHPLAGAAGERVRQARPAAYDALTLADFGTFWNGMIMKVDRLLGHLPID